MLRHMDEAEEERHKADAKFFRATAVHVIGNITTVFIIALLYALYLLFDTCIWAIMWAVLAAISLHPIKCKLMQAIGSTQLTDFVYWKLVLGFYLPVATAFFSTMSLNLTASRSASILVGLIVAAAPPIFLMTIRQLSRHGMMVHRYLLDDNTMITIVLILTIVGIAATTVVFFTAACASEFLAATQEASRWFDDFVVEAEASGHVGGVNITEQVGELKVALVEYIRGYNDDLNGTVYAAASARLIKHLEAEAIGSHSSPFDATHKITEGIQASLEELLGKNYTVSSIASFAYDQISNTTHLQNAAVQAAKGGTGAIASGALWGLMVLSGLADLGIQAVLFLSALYYLLVCERSVHEMAISHMPMPDNMKDQLVQASREVTRAVLLLPAQLAMFHCLFVLGNFWIFGLPYKYFAMFLAFIFSLVPILPSGLTPLPWAFAALLQGQYLTALWFGYGIYFVLGYVDWYWSERELPVHPFVVTLTMGLGYTTFGLKGLVLGPILICDAFILIRIYTEFQEEGGLQSPGIRRSNSAEGIGLATVEPKRTAAPKNRPSPSPATTAASTTDKSTAEDSEPLPSWSEFYSRLVSSIAPSSWSQFLGKAFIDG